MVNGEKIPLFGIGTSIILLHRRKALPKGNIIANISFFPRVCEKKTSQIQTKTFRR